MIKHTASEITVFKSTNYGSFSKICGNRDLNPTKIKKILADIETGTDILKECPILVIENDDKLDIFDGQHRFNISRLLKRPIYYIVVSPLSLEQIAKVNSNQEKWKQKDFINCYVQNKNENYIELKRFMDTFKFSLGVSLQMLCSTSVADSGSRALKDFENGNLMVTEKDNAWNLAKIIFKFNFLKFYSSRIFVTAITKIIESGKVEIDVILESCIKHSDKITTQPSWKLYIQNIELVCNIGKHSRVIIY